MPAEKHIGLPVNARCSSPIIIKIGMFLKILVMLRNIKLYENSYTDCQVLSRGQMDRQADKCGEAVW
jgi:hypothetical protein